MMTQVTTAEQYYYGSGAINCQSATDSYSGGTFTPYVHSFISYIDSGPTAVAATNINWTGNDMNGSCVDIHVNSQAVYGYSDGTTQARINTHAYYCNTSTTASDWFAEQVKS